MRGTNLRGIERDHTKKSQPGIKYKWNRVIWNVKCCCEVNIFPRVNEMELEQKVFDVGL